MEITTTRNRSLLSMLLVTHRALEGEYGQAEYVTIGNDSYCLYYHSNHHQFDFCDGETGALLAIIAYNKYGIVVLEKCSDDFDERKLYLKNTKITISEEMENYND